VMIFKQKLEDSEFMEFRITQILFLFFAIITMIIFLGGKSSAISIDEAEQKAKGLPKSSILQAMYILEKAIEEHPNDAKTAKLYLALGKLKNKYGTVTIHGFNGKYAEQYPKEYKFFGIGNDYYYTGYHFQELIDLFPKSDLVDDAAYELTNIFCGVDCESTKCGVEHGLAPLEHFIGEYPKSEFTKDAIVRINEIFISSLKWIKDLTSQSNDYDPNFFRSYLEGYYDIVQLEPLTPSVRALAYDTIGYFSAKYLDYDRARECYEYIIKEVPQYKDILDIKKRLSELPSIKFELFPAQVVNFSYIILKWISPQIQNIKGFSIYRSNSSFSRGEGERISGILNPGVTGIIDESIQPDTEYWYRVKVHFDGKEAYSNEVFCKTLSNIILPAGFLFRQADRSLYVFGRIIDNNSNKLIPIGVKISEDGKTQERLKGNFFGLDSKFFNMYKIDEKYSQDLWLIDTVKQELLHLDTSNIGMNDWKIIFLSSRGKANNTPNREPYVINIEELKRYLKIALSIDYKNHKVFARYLNTWTQSIAVDSKNDLCWLIDVDYVDVFNSSGNFIKGFKFQQEGMRTTQIENFARVYPDINDGTAWLYSELFTREPGRKSVDFKLINIDRFGKINRLLPLSGGSFLSPPFPVFDNKDKYFWYYDEKNYLLNKMSIEGNNLISVPIKDLPKMEQDQGKPIGISQLALDEKTESLWILYKNKIVKLNPDGSVSLNIEIPTSLLKDSPTHEEIESIESMTTPIIYPVAVTNLVNQEPVTTEVSSNPQAFTLPDLFGLNSPIKKGINLYLVLGAGLVVLVLILALVMVRKKK